MFPHCFVEGFILIALWDDEGFEGDKDVKVREMANFRWIRDCWLLFINNRASSITEIFLDIFARLV